MKFRFKQTSCVAVGTFNIYVVQPKLLSEMGVIKVEAGKNIAVVGDLSQPGIRFEFDRTKWSIRPERLAIETQSPNVDCGSYMQRVLQALRWTPVMAIGVNTEFVATLESAQIPDIFRLPQVDKAESQTCHVGVPFNGETKLNIQLTKNADRLNLILNLHTDFASRQKSESQQSLNESVLDLCADALKMREESVEIAKAILGGEFNYESD